MVVGHPRELSRFVADPPIGGAEVMQVIDRIVAIAVQVIDKLIGRVLAHGTIVDLAQVRHGMIAEDGILTGGLVTLAKKALAGIRMRTVRRRLVISAGRGGALSVLPGGI